ncbi:hypothetical protein GCM10027186_43580 [Micromonospora schwarzwaldensis]
MQDVASTQRGHLRPAAARRGHRSSPGRGKSVVAAGDDSQRDDGTRFGRTGGGLDCGLGVGFSSGTDTPSSRVEMEEDAPR